MAKSLNQLALPYEPVAPLPATDARTWLPQNDKLTHFVLGNRAFVQEITGRPASAPGQKWRWRVAALGGDTGICDNAAAAMRAAEFVLGLGEMPVRLPEIASRTTRKTSGGGGAKKLL